MAEDRPQLTDRSDLCIEADRYDRRVYREIFNESPTLQNMVREGCGALPTFAGLVQDVFSGLFKTIPHLMPSEALRPDVRVNRTLLEKAMETTEWQALRADTVLDEGSASIGTLQMARTLAQECESSPKLKAMMEQAQQAAQAVQQAAFQEMAGNQGEADACYQQAEEIAQAIQQAMDENASTVRVAVRRAAEAGQKSAEEAARVLARWGFGHGERQHLPVEKQLELLKKLTSPQFKKLTDMIGRFVEVTDGHMATRNNRPMGDIHGVKTGKDLETALPIERARLAHPLGRYDAARRMLEGQLYQYSLRQKPKLGKGPIVVLDDTSLSTERKVNNEYRIRDFTKATCMGLYHRAEIEHRAASFTPFDDTAPETIYLKAGEKDPMKLIQVASTWYGGGTNFLHAIDAGREAVRLTPDLKNGDMVLVTDGEWDGWDRHKEWVDAFKAEKKRLGYRLIGVAIRPMDTKSLERVCDVVIKIEPTADGYAEILRVLG